MTWLNKRSRRTRKPSPSTVTARNVIRLRLRHRLRPRPDPRWRPRPACSIITRRLRLPSQQNLLATRRPDDEQSKLNLLCLRCSSKQGGIKKREKKTDTQPTTTTYTHTLLCNSTMPITLYSPPHLSLYIHTHPTFFLFLRHTSPAHPSHITLAHSYISHFSLLCFAL